MQLAARAENGATARDHMAAAADRSGIPNALLGSPDIPPEAAGVWDAYWSLAGSRRSGMSMHALALTDIEAWTRLYGVRLTGWELDTLKAMDDACRMAWAAQQERERAATKGSK